MVHIERVKKMRDTMKDRKQFKEQGKSISRSHEGKYGMGTSHSQVESHPILKEKAQFSLIDTKVNSLPDKNKADTNLEQQEELKYRFGMQPKPGLKYQSPKFRPY
jgi:hypothetical protein